MDLGYAYVETDVHVSADGVVYAFHDVSLSRMAGDEAAIETLVAEQVDAVVMGGRAPIPRLADVLVALPSTRFNIDVKTDAGVEPTLAVVAEARAEERVCLASFSDARLRRIRSLAPGVATSFGPAEVAALRLGPVELVRAHGVRRGGLAVQVPERRGRVTVVNEAFVRHAHDLGLFVHVWTVDDPDAMHRLLDLGVDGIVTDRPDVLRDVLVDRGEPWPPVVPS